MSRTSEISPDFIAASTRDELGQLLLDVQSILGGEIKYISIGKDGSEFVAWFFTSIDQKRITREIRESKSKKAG